LLPSLLHFCMGKERSLAVQHCLLCFHDPNPQSLHRDAASTSLSGLILPSSWSLCADMPAMCPCMSLHQVGSCALILVISILATHWLGGTFVAGCGVCGCVLLLSDATLRSVCNQSDSLCGRHATSHNACHPAIKPNHPHML